MINASTELIAELNTLLRMTRLESWTAQTRRSQARDAQVERELADNADNSRKRAESIREMIKDLGGAPDVVGTTLSRAAALARLPLDQSQSLQSALMDDLVLEHSLRDRAVFTRLIAEYERYPNVVGLMEEVEDAHTETIEWINGVLAEIAAGETAALRPTTAQNIAGSVRRAGWYGAVLAAKALNRSADRMRRAGDEVSDGAQRAVDATRRRFGQAEDEVSERAHEAGSGLREVAQAAEAGMDEARSEFDRGAEGVDGIPIRNYDELTAADAAAAVHHLDQQHDIQAVLRHERDTKDRKTVITAAEERLHRLDRGPAHA